MRSVLTPQSGRRPGTTPATSSGRVVSSIAAVAAVAVILAGCGGDGEASSGLDATAQRGRQLAQDRGCVNCHSSDGDAGTGPTWEGIWGTTVELEDGRRAVVDRDYVARSVRDPDADVVQGFNPVMPGFDLSDAEIDDLVAYLQALGDSN